MTGALPSADEVRRWAGDTWRCLAATAYEPTGLPADGIDERLDPTTRTPYTSPTNIAGYLWSALAASRLGLIAQDEARARCSRVLATLAGLARHQGSGMFYNWYDVATGERTRTWGRRGRILPAFLSSVDNAWLALALRIVAAGEPTLAGAATAILTPMRFDAFYDPGARPVGGLMRGGFWETPRRNRSVPGRDPSGAPIHLTRHHYALLNSETRLVTYVALAAGQVGAQAYAALEAPIRRYAGCELVASLGGSMFEALAVPAFVPEAAWAPELWGANHAGTVRAHRAFAAEVGAPVWGLSPCACPGAGSAGGYSEFGVPAIGLLGDSYRTTWRGQVVVTPHAAALALPYDAPAAMTNLSRLAELGCYGPGGFVDSIGVRTRRTAGRHLTLDQAFLMAGLVHRLTAGAGQEGLLHRLAREGGLGDAVRHAVVQRSRTVAIRVDPEAV
ncbi:MAG: DUF3131 domain-containing protein [Austwickia sp.]|nr:DUF3131 domain-containing protein [Austwickia sp.]MCO5308453.1 DUF3131 domain-containing protein [Austwickia sp.]